MGEGGGEEEAEEGAVPPAPRGLASCSRDAAAAALRGARTHLPVGFVGACALVR